MCVHVCGWFNHIQCIRKVFRRLDFFHIMLRCNLILKLITSFFSPYLHIIPHNDKKIYYLEFFDNVLKITQLFRPFTLLVLCWSTFDSDYSLKSSWVWRYKLGKPVFGEFLAFFSADPLKLCQVGWGVSLNSYFQVSPEMFRSGLLPWSWLVSQSLN